MQLDEIPTPAGVVDLDRLEQNCAEMSERALRLGVRLRPHVKTHKCVEAARMQVRRHFGGITVSTLAEAEAFSRGGFRDLVWAVPAALDKIRRAAGLAAKLDRFAFLLDHPDTARALSAEGERRGRPLEAFLKLDCGYHRAGVDPSDPGAVDLAVRLAEDPWIVFRGLLTHAGHAYAARNRDETARIAEQERDVPVRFGAALESSGLEVPEISVGSTPTIRAAANLEGVDEVRPGNYALFDRFQVAIGSCRESDVAFAVLGTVLGRYPRRLEAVLDTGALALSRDPGPTHVDPHCGFGCLADLEGRTLPGCRLTALSQEHGLVRCESANALAPLQVGSRVRVVPNHACLAVAQFERLVVVRETRITDEWMTCRGW